MSAIDLTPEQQEQLLKSFAQLADAAAKIAEAYAAAVKPIIDAYNSLPPELKEQIAKAQVEQKLGHEI
jgi:hypothetical protein